MKMASMRNRVRAGVLLTLAMVVTLVLVLTHATPALSQGTSTVGVSDLDEPAAGNTSMVGYTSTFHDEDSAVSFCNGYSNTDSYGFSVDENTSENTVVGTVAACEPHGDSLTYSVGGTDVAKFNEVFDLNASTGEITVKSGASIDYEGGKRSYSLTVTVTDAEDSSEATVPMSITVINVDEPGTVTLSQATPGVGSALRPTLDDPDGWVVLFKVQWSRADTADGPFTLLNFRYISSLRKASYTPETADEGKFLKVTLFYIDRQCRVVNSYNNQCRRMAAKTADNAVATAGTNNAPVFSSSNVSRSIAENTAAGQNVGAAVTATDADAGDTLGYTLGGADAASFDFVESSGQIRTKSGVTYDFEAKSSYTVTVTASDGTDTAVATVTISVTDVDEPPSAPATPMVSAVSGSTTSLSVSWAAPANAGKPAIASYDVQYRVGSSGAWSDGPEDVAGTSTTITSLVASTDYEARVRATNAEGDSGWSDPPGAGRTNFLVGNFGQTVDGAAVITLVRDIVGAFTAGALGAELHNIEFRLFVQLRDIDSAQLPSVTLYRGSVLRTRATTGTLVATLSAAPGSSRPSDTVQTVAFIAPGGTRLDADTTYLVVLTGEGSVRVEATTSPAEDAGGASGWTIDGVGAGSSSPYSYQTTPSLRMRVNGTAGAPATGVPGITGTVGAGETLTATTDLIEDEDGLTGATFTYQWLVDGAEINGATDSSYIVIAADEGKPIEVRVAFTDDAGNPESLISNPFLSAPPLIIRDVPVIASNTPATGAPTITGTVRVGETLTSTTTDISDSDGLNKATFTYQWLADDADITDATGSTYTLVAADEGKTVKVRITFTDDAGNDESLTSAPTATVTASNTPATGEPTITGTAQVGETLTANTTGIADSDGLINATFTYQWLADDTDITDATGSTYTLAGADEGKTVKVRVTFTDDRGHQETLTSTATAAVTAAPSPLTVSVESAPTSHNGSNSFRIRVAFSETPRSGFSYTTMRDHAFTVTGGDVTGARRLVSGKNLRWEVTVQPSGTADVTVELPVTTDCATQGAICTDNDDKLSNSLNLTVSGPEATPPPAVVVTALTVSVESAPTSHNGSNSFRIRIALSEAPKSGFSYTTMRDHAFTVTGGDVTGARRLVSGKNLRWEITVQPSGNADVTVELPATTNCAAQGAICTGNDDKLSNSLNLTVSGPN